MEMEIKSTNKIRSTKSDQAESESEYNTDSEELDTEDQSSSEISHFNDSSKKGQLLVDEESPEDTSVALHCSARKPERTFKKILWPTDEESVDTNSKQSDQSSGSEVVYFNVTRQRETILTDRDTKRHSITKLNRTVRKTVHLLDVANK